MPPILVTGATGFLGRVLAAELERRGLAWRAARTRLPGSEEAWRAELAGVESVFHLAGITHAPAAAAAALHEVNAVGARVLARAAAAAGVRRLIFASSVRAIGARTAPGERWTEAAPCRPRDPYGRSKLAAERALAEEAERGSLAIVALRLPLLYGPSVRANLERLMRAVAGRRVLPFGAVHNLRSLLGATNAADALLFVARHPQAAGRVLLARDADWSTAGLIHQIADALGVAPRLWSVPPPLLALAPGRPLRESLAVDDSALRALGWAPPCSPAEEWRRAARAFRGAPTGS